MNDNETIYDKLVRLVTSALEDLEQQKKLPAKSDTIREWIGSRSRPDMNELSNSWASYLARAKSDPKTRIRQIPGTYKYTLAAKPEAQPEPTEASPTQEEQEETRAYSAREAKLYPIMRDWLIAQRYRARVTARERAGGVWGNPDVTGIRIREGFLQQRDIEITTVELKLTHKRWKYDFFEAVAHKRFSHRAYFAFGYGTDQPGLERIDDLTELREYGEKYGVGILAIFVPRNTFEALVTGAKDAITKLGLSLDEVDVTEVWPGLYQAPRVGNITDFLACLGLQDDDALYRFGLQDDDA